MESLAAINGKIANVFSEMISQYVLENEKVFKSVISKREKVHKIMLKINGLLAPLYEV